MRAGWGFRMCLLLFSACGGQSVEPLDPRDATLPAETRQWVADAEDGVLIARTRRDLLVGRLREVEAWRDKFLDVKWGGSAAAQVRAAGASLADARVALAAARLEHADVAVDLAASKYDLANAERAMLHDLQRYDLGPLREQADRIRERLAAAGTVLAQRRKGLERSTQRFWQAYGHYVQAGGETHSFWTTDP